MVKGLVSVIIVAALVAGCRSSILDDPSTAITYSIPQPSHVHLTVENGYNTIVATLVDGDYNAGFYTAVFNPAGLQEGIYFYTLEVKGTGTDYSYTQTKYFLTLK